MTSAVLGHLLPTAIPCGGGYGAELFTGLGAARDACERELVERGLTLPFQHRAVWAASGSESTAENCFLAVRDPQGRWSSGFTLGVARSRVLPGHLLLRVERFGVATSPEVRAAALEALVNLARAHGRVLRVYVEVFSPDAGVREQVESAALALGYRRPKAPRGYTDTVTVQLAADEAAMLASLGQKTRKNIREVTARGFAIRAITDPHETPRMEALMRETVARTGGTVEVEDWGRVVAFAAAHPTLAHIVGTVRTGTETPDALVAFSWARSHGDHVEVRATASTRLEGVRVGLTYPLVWDLMCWGRRVGASWLDLGGVTLGTHGSADPLGGISDFKRAFSKTVIRVGDEWVYEPHRYRALVASAASRVWSRLRRA